ncbi:MAG: dockerin type I domain-containing protein, partial [Bacteroidota bacterium]
MKSIKRWIFLFLLTYTFQAWGQAPCIDINLNASGRWIFAPSDWKDDYTPQELAGPFCIPIQFHNVRDDNGNGGQSQAIADQMTIALNGYFAGANFDFRQVAPVNYIDDSELLAVQGLAPFATHRVAGAVNVYLVNITINTGGTAAAPMESSNNGVLMPYNNPNLSFQMTTLAHEMGHYFGLRHTHEGSKAVYDPDAPFQYYQLTELVDPNPPNGIDDDDILVHHNNTYHNCEDSPYTWTNPNNSITYQIEIAGGDMVADTPADAELDYDLQTCVFTEDKYDANNDKYEPLINNLMSYYYFCRSSFTPGQMDRSLFYYLDFIQYELSGCPPPNNEALSETVLRMPGSEGLRNVSVEINYFEDGDCSLPTGIACQPAALTDALGQFFCDFPLQGAATAELEKEDDWFNGLTTYDLVLISQHRLGIQPLDGWNQIAADANNDGKVDAADITLLRDLILYKFTELPVEGNLNSPWRFFPELIPFLNGDHFDPPSFSDTPFEISDIFPYPDYLGSDFCYPVTTPYRDEMGFHAVKVGDVNQSANTQNLVGNSSSDRSQAIIDLTNPHPIQRGETFTLQLSAERFQNIAAFGLGLYLDTERVQLEGIKTGELPQFQIDHFGTQRLAEKELRVLWVDERMAGHQLTPDQTLFQLQLRALEDINQLQSILQINQHVLVPEFISA